VTRKTAPFPERLAKYLQLGSHETARREARLLWEEALGLINPSAWKTLLTVDAFYAVFHPYAQSSESIQKLLEDVCHVWLFAATIGDELTRRSREYLAQREAFRGYILDRMGSFLVEEQIRRIDNSIMEQCAEKGLKTTRRYSPGYRDFPLEAQSVFHELIKDEFPDLKLSRGGLLLPEKTVTAIKGELESRITGEANSHA
jgi:hypothetical protein